MAKGLKAAIKKAITDNHPLYRAVKIEWIQTGKSPEHAGEWVGNRWNPPFMNICVILEKKDKK